MTPEAAVREVRASGHIVMIHRGECFFNTFDHDEVLRWEQRGAFVTPHFTLDEIEARKRKGKHTSAAWEVHLLGAITPVEIEDTDGDFVNVTKDALLAAARDKVAV